MKPVTKRRPKVRKTRRPLLQKLEDRMLLAGDWTNPCAAHDISGDGHVSPLDALLPINQLDRLGSVPLSAERPADSPYFDADANDQLSPRDALVVINSLAMIGEASAHNSVGEFKIKLKTVDAAT
ncbi:MAG: dockerin type I domain-containing protein, partial [Planctomycetota bacterium]